jgi:hypothetical protein
VNKTTSAPIKTTERVPTNGAHADSAAQSAVIIAAPRRKRRWLSLVLTALAGISLFVCGALIGYTQGPPLATLIASGQSFVQVGAEFQACFTAASNDSGVRSFFSAFARSNRPTRTPGPAPTLDPTLLRVVKGELVALTGRDVTVQTAAGARERFPLVPLAQVVSPCRHQIESARRHGRRLDQYFGNSPERAGRLWRAHRRSRRTRHAAACLRERLRRFLCHR